MFVMAKKLKLFASTLDGIPISARCVSSMIIVLNAKSARLLAAHANKKTRGDTKKPDNSVVLC